MIRWNVKIGLAGIAILLAFLLLVLGKCALWPCIESMPLSMMLFWMGSGCLFSLLLFPYCIQEKRLPLYFSWKCLPLSILGLCAFHLYFLYEIPGEYQNRPYFFLWAPVLYWLASFLFRKKRNFFRLFCLALFFLLLLREKDLISLMATGALVSFALYARDRKKDGNRALFSGVIFEVFVMGCYAFVYGVHHEALCMTEIYGAFWGGVYIGIVLQIFLAVWHQSAIPILLVFLFDLTLPIDREMALLLSFLLLFFAVMCLNEVKKRDLGQEAPLIHLR